MDYLKLKFKINGIEFEAEGSEKTVKEEFAQFKNFMANQLSEHFYEALLPSINGKTVKHLNSPEKHATVIRLNEKNHEKAGDEMVSEIDWILLYALHASNNGETKFSREFIKTYYDKNKEKDAEALASLARHLRTLMRRGYVRQINGSDFFIVTPIGIEYGEQLLDGASIEEIDLTNRTFNSQAAKNKMDLSIDMSLEDLIQTASI